MGQKKNKTKEKSIIAAATFIMCFAAAYIVAPDKASWLPPCPFYTLTCLYCPGCGTLRALHEIAHGHIIDAWHLNPLIIIILPALIYSALAELGIKNLKPISLSARRSWILFAVLLAFGVARNIPAYPFTLLAPH